MGKIRFCTGLTKASKAGQKSIVPAQRAQRTNHWKTPFICMYSKSPLLSLFQQSAGATPLWSGWWWRLVLSTSNFLYIQQQELTVMEAEQPLLEQPEWDNLSGFPLPFPLSSWEGRRTGPIFYVRRPLWCSLPMHCCKLMGKGGAGGGNMFPLDLQ
jgi:hypothetical protein